jgi:hypothetical protein
LAGGLRLRRQQGGDMQEWTFSATAEWVVGGLLVGAIVAVMFV